MCICGRVGCFGLCDDALGKRLVDFLNGIDTVSARIGEIEKDSRSSDYLIVTGARYFEENESVTTILKPLSKVKSIPRITRFKLRDRENTAVNKDKRLEKTPVKLINNYSKSKSCVSTDEEIQRALNILSKIDGNKEMLMPIKVGKPISIMYKFKTAAGVLRKEMVDCKVSSVKWSLEDGELHCTIMGKPDKQQKTLTVWLEDYGDDLILRNLVDTIKKCEYHDEIIKMDQYGYIKTIVLYHGEHVAVVDCNNLYYGDNILKLKEIGTWCDNRLTGLKDVEDRRLQDIIKQNENYIASHKRWIVPYLLGDFVSIKVKDAK